MRSIKSCVGAPEQGALGCIQKLVWNVLWGCVLKAVDSVLQDSKVSFLGIHHLLNHNNNQPGFWDWGLLCFYFGLFEMSSFSGV